MNRTAFSLVELSIVLVILGLLTGGILSGQSLIRASELRAAVSEYQRYSTAVQSFRDKYFAIPGDMTNAESFWTTDAKCGSTYAGTTANAGTCNGTGDGILSPAAAVSKTGEVFQFWKQLALAGLIEGSYTGFSGPTTATIVGYDSILGVNVPKSKMSNSGWSVQSFSGYWVGDGNSWPGNYGNIFYLGALNPGTNTGAPNMKPEEAWNIDTKLDDGKPGTGKVVVYGRANCTSSTMASPATDMASATYNLSVASNLCAIWYVNAF